MILAHPGRYVSISQETTYSVNGADHFITILLLALCVSDCICSFSRSPLCRVCLWRLIVAFPIHNHLFVCCCVFDFCSGGVVGGVVFFAFVCIDTDICLDEESFRFR